MESKSDTTDDLSVAAERPFALKGSWMHGDGSVVTSTTLKACIVPHRFLGLDVMFQLLCAVAAGVAT